jgi:hypothetical protein
MIREAGALFGMTVVGVGSLYGYGQYQDLQRSYGQLQKKAHMYETSYRVQTEQRNLREEEVKALQKEIEDLKNDDSVVKFGIGALAAIGAVGVYTMTQMR